MVPEHEPTSNFLLAKLFDACGFKKFELPRGMHDLLTTSAVIDALDGTTAVSELTGATPSAVSNWRDQESFPAWTYLSIKNGLQAKGRVAPDNLWKMEPPLSKKRRAAADAS